MRVPPIYLTLTNAPQVSTFEADFPASHRVLPDGTWEACLPDSRIIYPPVGFLPWPFCSIGNGDDYGYYWPVGREEHSPLVMMMSHDYGGLNPIASSIEALERMGDHPDLSELLGRGETSNRSNDEQKMESERPDISARLALDEDSPFLLVANADAAVGRNEYDVAESLYLRAIELLPEYTAAHFGLVVLYRRNRRTGDALKAMIATIRCPLCFRGASFWADTYLPTDHVNRQDFHKKCFHWLQQTRSAPSHEIADDPLFQARGRLTFASGVTTNDDYLVYDEVIDAYVRLGRTIEAIQLGMRYGELMMGETTPFRERYCFTTARHRIRLRQLFHAANLADRSKLVE